MTESIFLKSSSILHLCLTHPQRETCFWMSYLKAAASLDTSSSVCRYRLKCIFVYTTPKICLACVSIFSINWFTDKETQLEAKQ
jgi:hypothetical protein